MDGPSLEELNVGVVDPAARDLERGDGVPVGVFNLITYRAFHMPLTYTCILLGTFSPP